VIKIFTLHLNTNNSFNDENLSFYFSNLATSYVRQLLNLINSYRVCANQSTILIFIFHNMTYITNELFRRV